MSLDQSAIITYSDLAEEKCQEIDKQFDDATSQTQDTEQSGLNGDNISTLAVSQPQQVQQNPELEQWDLKIIQIDNKYLAKKISKFIAVGSTVHKLTSDELTIVANMKGKYINKEEKLIHNNGGMTVPDTVTGLMANGTKFLDAIIYLDLEPNRRPKPSPSDMHGNDDEELKIPTYDDLSKLITYIFVVFFYVLIRAHVPSKNKDNKGQPMPKFITLFLGVTDPIADIHAPARNISQEAINSIGLGVAGYRLVSVFNILKPDLYCEAPVPSGKVDIKKKPNYIDTAVSVARSFVTAGHCWDFHPATRNPNIITKYGNINKNASNLLTECYTKDTLLSLVKIKKLALVPQFDPSHTNFRLWDETMVYKATKPIFSQITSTYSDLEKSQWKAMLKRRLSSELNRTLLSAYNIPNEHHAYVAYLRDSICFSAIRLRRVDPGIPHSFEALDHCFHCSQFIVWCMTLYPLCHHNLSSTTKLTFKSVTSRIHLIY
ncbi:hypothetical protein EPUL_002789 [Erysiphe pulchra]|uniref:Uncharacterized protein n=1 Tax=Erysiphe pulchra TaxID=225359 RepID=A0A2S4PTD1_9PEZI|nr:hypothetical protein EPUL_002789 [Erysiphe pulchra]